MQFEKIKVVLEDKRIKSVSLNVTINREYSLCTEFYDKPFCFLQLNEDEFNYVVSEYKNLNANYDRTRIFKVS